SGGNIGLMQHEHITRCVTTEMPPVAVWTLVKFSRGNIVHRGLEARMRAARITVCGRAAQSSFPLAPDELRQQSSQRFRDELRRFVLGLESVGDGCLDFADRA